MMDWITDDCYKIIIAVEYNKKNWFVIYDIDRNVLVGRYDVDFPINSVAFDHQRLSFVRVSLITMILIFR